MRETLTCYLHPSCIQQTAVLQLFKKRLFRLVLEPAYMKKLYILKLTLHNHFMIQLYLVFKCVQFN